MNVYLITLACLLFLSAIAHWKQYKTNKTQKVINQAQAHLLERYENFMLSNGIDLHKVLALTDENLEAMQKQTVAAAERRRKRAGKPRRSKGATRNPIAKRDPKNKNGKARKKK